MSDKVVTSRKQTLDKDLEKLVHVEEATGVVAQRLVAPGLGLLFIALAAIFASVYAFDEPRAALIVVAAALGAYMAMNIGANDVANNVGPAVGARALTLGGALIIAAVFESAGALIAGGDVIGTVANGIVQPSAVGNPEIFIRLMLAALISSALWINLATWLGAPVSTTHAVVGGVVGAGIAAAGFSAVNWALIGGIAASWVVSPLLGGVIAAIFLAAIKALIIYQEDKIAAARRWLPLLVALMAGSFAAYLATKGLRRIIDLPTLQVVVIAGGVFAASWVLAAIGIRRQSRGMENRNQSLRRLFTLPLIFSAALLSFGHGANDVANAIGPVAAIVQAAGGADVGGQIAVPFWVMIIGALGISFGLVLFGARLIRMVGEQITKLNPMRAFCVALSAAITVILASALAMPISSTHVAVGAVFGVGFFREWYTAHSPRRRRYMERRNVVHRESRAALQAHGPEAGGEALVPVDGADLEEAPFSSEDVRRRRLVRRAHVSTIVAAWVTTVPAAAVLSALVFLALDLLA